MRAAKSRDQHLDQTCQFGIIDRARRIVGARDIRREARQAAGLVEADFHPFAEIEIDEGIAPAAAMLFLKRGDAVAQRRDPVRDHDPEGLGLGIEMRVERA